MAITKNLIISDIHVPDQNVKAMELVYKFIGIYKPTTLHILGDFLNFPTLSTYPQDPDYHIKLSEEINEGHSILKKFRKLLPTQEILYYLGNHDDRLSRYLARNAAQLASLEIEGERVVSIPHLLGLGKLNIKYVEKEHRNGVLYHHGELVRGKAGYTAQGNLEKFGVSVICGHVHRLALVYKNLYDRSIFGMETGCLCNRKPYPYYGTMVKDWQLGLATIDVVNGVPHPRIYPIINNSLSYGDKIISV